MRSLNVNYARLAEGRNKPVQWPAIGRITVRKALGFKHHLQCFDTKSIGSNGFDPGDDLTHRPDPVGSVVQFFKAESDRLDEQMLQMGRVFHDHYLGAHRRSSLRGGERNEPKNGDWIRSALRPRCPHGEAARIAMIGSLHFSRLEARQEKPISRQRPAPLTWMTPLALPVACRASMTRPCRSGYVSGRDLTVSCAMTAVAFLAPSFPVDQRRGTFPSVQTLEVQNQHDRAADAHSWTRAIRV